MTNALLSLAAAALALAASAAAGDASGRQHLTTRVSYADLDLSSAAGRAKLDLRLARAAASLCGPANPLDPAGPARRRDCVAAARAAAEPHVAEAVRKAAQAEVAALR